MFDSLDNEHNNITALEQTLLIERLTPKTQYQFVMFLYYEKRLEPYMWPKDHLFIYETLGDRPSTPGRPRISHVSGDAYQVTWESSRDNGAIIEEYVLEGVQRRREKPQIVTNTNTTDTNNSSQIMEENVEEQLSGTWEIFFNGTNTYWITRNMKSIGLFDFRVRAKNSYGWSDYSPESDQVEFGKSEPEKKVMLALYISLPIFVILVIVLAIAIVCGRF